MVTEEHSWFIWMWAVEIGGVVITFTVHLHGCQKQGLKDLIFVSRLRQSVQGRATMAKTIQCADGLEKVTPFKHGDGWYLRIYVRFLGCSTIYIFFQHAPIQDSIEGTRIHNEVVGVV